MSETLSDRISACMKRVLKDFEKIRGQSKEDGFSIAFWDIVVITAADEEQKKAYELQLYGKLQRNEIPKGIPYHVYADPPGYKLGSGGSTFTALSELHKIYNQDLFDKKILMIHAGGQSQRLPSASVLGKIFSALPLGEPMYQLLELKLAMYLPVIEKMSPGVLLTSSDTLELFNDGEESDWAIDKPGFTAFAHPSSLEIGTGHGVYVLEEPKKMGKKKVEEALCLEVLQKPSVKLMYDKGAVIEKKDTNSKAEDPYVYSDSMFYFDHTLTQKMLKWYEENGPIQCEICAYGDFLQPLGPRATGEYIHNTSNVSHMEPALLKTREQMFSLLKGTQLNLVVFNESKFYHVGTTHEYIDNLCHSQSFSQELGLSRDAFSHFSQHNARLAKMPKLESAIAGCVMHSCLPSQSAVAASAVVEYSHFKIPVKIGANCIISNCFFDDDQSEELSLDIPANTFLHTIPMVHNGGTCYATVVYGTNDNIKKRAADRESAGQITFLGKDLKRACEFYKLKQPGDLFEKNPKALNLWFCQLFPVVSNMGQSCYFAVQMAKHMQSSSGDQELDLSGYPRVSMADLLETKDVAAMLEYREKLRKVIEKAHHH
ncbi:fucose-1-phosphate guanylyltransferase isoform X2 [Lingula anatina]|uniref:Fucose-1-phosphate guanylyltransferase isoform X1 n=1 Tax=Lingula anatina TaxID=7574 RepID=A0A1S3J057_LINAN|nr:fucose-1-phosphate guanylyltransferase isoform X1 [Lingula anatina]XP_013403631.1 fucose-1-phosphate guanylyltransferase isoform X2 [Lingula anatina]|eukprot:XP_013403630.1 fucose-1-phosphate guanylyltransferase isoform X1 [Lingula anatina]